MSTIQANAILDASGGNTTTINGVTPNTDSVRGRNLIINGAMQVAQRGTSASVTTAGSSYDALDRFESYRNSSYAPNFTVSRDTTGPAGFSRSLKVSAACTIPLIVTKPE